MVIGMVFLIGGIFNAVAQADSHANDALPDGGIAWDALMKAVDATNGQDAAWFTFAFTNVTPETVTVLNVHPSCGCTTAELPPVPWQIPANGTGQIKLSVNLQGKSGTLFKTVNVTTDKGSKALSLRINILAAMEPQVAVVPAAPIAPVTPVKPQPAVQMSADRRAEGLAAAKLDRQAVFKGECASCHVKGTEDKYGQQLYAAACGICHEASPRATMVTDLHNLSVPTSEEFWRSWITAGKPETLMPAFAKSQGGPLTDLQIASLAAYLNTVIPSRLAQATAK